MAAMLSFPLIYIIFCIFLANGAPMQSVPGFEEGKSYIYGVEVRFGTGVVKNNKKQFSAGGGRFKIAIENHRNELLLQYSNFENGAFNDKVNSFLEPIPIPYKPFTEEMKLHRIYNQPYAVRFENGLVKSIAYHKSLRVADLNVHRGIASLLQLHFQPPENADEHFYTVYENGVTGNCLTSYNIIHSPLTEAPEIQVLNITKSRHYDKCTYRPHVFHVTLQGFKCTSCKQNNFSPLGSFGHVEYKIKGNRQKYTIESIESNGANILAPFTSNGYEIINLSNITLNLLSIEEGTKILKPDDLIETKVLHFEFAVDARDHNEVDLKKSHVHIIVNEFEREARILDLAKFLPQFLKAFEDRKFEGENVQYAVRCLRTFDYEHFVFFFDNYVFGDDDKNHETIQIILFEILPYVGSNPSILFMFHLIEKKQVDVLTASRWLQNMPFHIREPSKKIVTAFKDFLKTESVNKYTILINSGWLAYGSLLHRGCNPRIFNPHPSHSQKYIEDEICTQLVSELIEKFKAADTENEQAVILRAIKNTHSQNALKLLSGIAQGGYPVLLRVEAVWGLFFHIQNERSKMTVKAILVNILTNTQEDYVLRIYALAIYVYTSPNPQTFTEILLKLHKEPCQKVSSYAYNLLVEIANSTDPCLEEMVENVRATLQYLEKPKYDILRHSVLKHFSSYNAQYNFGRSIYFHSVPSNISAFPRALYFGQSFNILGYNFEFLELGYVSEGNNLFENILLHILQPETLAPGKSKEEEPMREHLKHVIDVLKLQDTTKDQVKDYEIFVKSFNQDVFYSRDFEFEQGPDFDNPSVQFGEGRLNLNFHRMIFLSGWLTIPNEFGFPVYFTVDTPVTYDLNGSIKVNPRLTSNSERVSLSKNLYGMNAEFDLKVTSSIYVDLNVFVQSTINERFGSDLRTYVDIKFPIKGSLDYDFNSQIFEMKYIPSEKEYDIINYDSIPTTWMTPEISKTIHEIDNTVNKQTQFGHHYFGVGLTINITLDDYNDHGNYQEFFRSFFKKPYSFETYKSFPDKLYAGFRGLIDYAILNPKGVPVKFNVRFSRCPTHPATEFLITMSREHQYDYRSDHAWKTKKFIINVTSEGAVERKWNLELRTTSHYPEEDVRRTAFKFQRSSAHGWYNEPFEICYSDNLNFENYLSIFENKHRPIRVKYDGLLLYGVECKDENSKITVKSEWSKIIRDHENVDISGSSSFYKDCEKNVQEGFHFSESCWKTFVDLGRLTDFEFNIETNKLTRDVKVILAKLKTLFRHKFYENLIVQPYPDPHYDLKEGQTRIYINTSYKYPIADIHVYRPNEFIHYHNIFLPSIEPGYEPFSVIETFSQRTSRLIFNYEAPICLMSNNFVVTFDRVIYKHLFGDCYYLLFADCSHQSVIVLAKNVKRSKFSKVIRIFLRNSQIDIEPKGDELEVKVNDEVQSLAQHRIYEHQFDEKTVFIISRYARGIFVQALDSKADFYTDGSNIAVVTSNFYRGHQCGLCGNMDGETAHEFVGPDRTLYKNSDDFAKSYAVQAHDCNPQ